MRQILYFSLRIEASQFCVKEKLSSLFQACPILARVFCGSGGNPKRQSHKRPDSRPAPCLRSLRFKIFQPVIPAQKDFLNPKKREMLIYKCSRNMRHTRATGSPTTFG